MNNKTKECLRLLRMQKNRIQQNKCPVNGYNARQSLELIKIADRVDEIKRDEKNQIEYRKSVDYICGHSSEK